jgi:glycosyltransferase involved in cell wall biosynthesis
MRLLFLGVHGPARSPSQRYRFEQFQPHLAARGFTLEYSGALTRADAEVFSAPAHPLAKATVALRALTTRTLSVLPRLTRRPDVVFVQREAFFLFNHWAEWLASLQAPVVFDFDDAIWIHAVSPANRRFAFLKNTTKIPRIVQLAHTVIAGNDYLADWARPLNPNTHVIPTCVDTDVYRPPVTRPTAGPVTIGWSGSPSTIAHLRLALPLLERLKARLGDRIRLRVMGDPTFVHPSLDLRGEAWSPEAELQFLREMDIGLMPLPDDEWTRGKCGLKGLTSMASGAATVMSPVGVNTRIVEDGVSGFLPASDDAWLEVLTRLVDDAPLRRRVGDAGRQRVVAEYSVQRWADPLADLLLQAARRG